jgi:GDP-4-dehydro-6-deoxy-D-mannose reductase
VSSVAPLAGRVALVTGANGFVGPWLVRELQRRGATVHGAGVGAAPAQVALAGWHAADLRDPRSLLAAVAAVKPDGVVHLAGQSSAARSFEHPVETFELNALGTWHLLEALREAAPRARVLLVTSGEIYGPQPEGTRASEATAMRPVSPYALSKAAADAFGEIAAERGQDVLRARSFGHTGPGQAPRFVIPAMAEQIATIEAGRGAAVLKVGNLEVTRDLLDVRDVARAYALLLERGHTGVAYNVCRGEGVRLIEVVRSLVAKARTPIRIEPDPSRMRPADVPYSVGDPAALERDTGWRAEIPLQQTLDDVLSEWRSRLGAEPRA